MYPIFDLHCDLLAFLALDATASPQDVERIGCATPFLQQGQVRIQVMALFSLTEKGSVNLGKRQVEIYQKLSQGPDFQHLEKNTPLSKILDPAEAVYMLPAIESASVFSEEEEELQVVLDRFDWLTEQIGTPLYLSLTHHSANRFGGGNGSELGLSEEGRKLLEHLSGRGMAIDMSHTSDALARDILDHIDSQGLDLHVIASHSNFREIQEHKRNLPDWLVAEIVKRKGLIGMNFVRDFVDPDHPERLLDHIRYGFAKGATQAMAFGADYFPPDLLPPEHQHRAPFFHPEHDNASKYPGILAKSGLNEGQSQALCYQNFANFLGLA